MAPTWIIERCQNVNRGLVLGPHFTVDDGAGGSLHLRDVVLHALRGVDQEAKSLTGPPGDSHHPAGGDRVR